MKDKFPWNSLQLCRVLTKRSHKFEADVVVPVIQQPLCKTYKQRTHKKYVCDNARRSTTDLLYLKLPHIHPMGPVCNVPYGYGTFLVFLPNLFMALNDLLCADVPLRKYSFTHWSSQSRLAGGIMFSICLISLVNMLFWKQMNQFCYKLVQVVYGARRWNGQLWGSGG